MLTRAIFAILWVTAGTEASAQAVTDLELKAAYCLGVANKTVEVWREDLTQTKSPERRDAAKAAIAQGETQRGRLWAYLRGRGFSWEEKGTGGRDPMLIAPLMSQGETDMMACTSQVSTPSWVSCVNTCLANTHAVTDADTLKCVNFLPRRTHLSADKKMLSRFLAVLRP